jgi:hypothetical protein
MRIAIGCGLLFGAIVLLPSAATAQFAEKTVLTLEIARRSSPPPRRRRRAITWPELSPWSMMAGGRS